MFVLNALCAANKTRAGVRILPATKAFLSRVCVCVCVCVCVVYIRVNIQHRDKGELSDL